MEKKLLELEDDSKEVLDDKTSKNEDLLEGIPSEDEDTEEKGEEKKKESVSSEIAQKIRWREKYQKAQNKIKELEDKVSRNPSKDSETNKEELQAQLYIRNQAREALKEMMDEERKEEEKAVQEFDDELDQILEENPDVTEEKLLEVIEEYEVEPETALKIIQSQGKGKKEKPSLPNPKRGSSETPKSKIDDKGKSMWQISQELAKEYLSKK